MMVVTGAGEKEEEGGGRGWVRKMLLVINYLITITTNSRHVTTWYTITGKTHC